MAGDKKYVTVEDMQTAIATATKVATDSAQKIQRDIREAERAIQPYVGNLAMTFDSAEDVYRKALKMIGVKGIDRVDASALRPILEMQPLPGSRKTASPSAKVAADAASTSDFNSRFPDAGRIRLS